MRPPSWILHNALQADDVSWLLPTVKIQQRVAFGCSNQAKNRKDTSISFHVFPKDNRLRRAWIQSVGRTSLPKGPRLCSEYFDAYCFKYTVRLRSELLGLCPWRRKLKPEAVPTIFPHKSARSVHVVTFGFLYTSAVSCHCVCVPTSCILTNLLSLSFLSASTTSAGRSRWFAGRVRGNSLRLRFCFQGRDPGSSFWGLIVYSKQSASKCSEHNRLNARQSENFTKFLLKASSKLLRSIKCFFSNIKQS